LKGGLNESTRSLPRKEVRKSVSLAGHVHKWQLSYRKSQTGACPFFEQGLVSNAGMVIGARVKSKFDPFLSQYPEPYRGRMKPFAV
jgi:hypothetical protein